MFEVIIVKPNIDISLAPFCDVNSSFVCGGHVAGRCESSVMSVPSTGHTADMARQSGHQTIKRVGVLGGYAEVVHKVVTTKYSQPAVRIVATL